MERPKELPRGTGVESNVVARAKREARDPGKHGMGMAAVAIAFLGGSDFGGFFSYATDAVRPTVRVNLSLAQAHAPVAAFFKRRPRPWRYHGNNRRTRSGLRKGGRTWLR